MDCARRQLQPHRHRGTAGHLTPVLVGSGTCRASGRWSSTTRRARRGPRGPRGATAEALFAAGARRVLLPDGAPEGPEPRRAAATAGSPAPETSDSDQIDLDGHGPMSVHSRRDRQSSRIPRRGRARRYRCSSPGPIGTPTRWRRSSPWRCAMPGGEIERRDRWGLRGAASRRGF